MSGLNTVDSTALPAGPERGFLHGASEVAVVVLLTGLAGALRVRGLGDWPLDSDEIETLHESIRLARPDQILASRSTWLTGPLMHGATRVLLQVCEDPILALRWLPAACGVAAVPVLYGLVRATFGPLWAFGTAVLLAFSPLHLHASSYGRYYAATFLFAGAGTLFALIAVRRGRRSAAVAAAACSLLAIGVHATALLGTLAAAIAAVCYPGGGRLRRVSLATSALGVAALLPLIWMGPRAAWVNVKGVLDAAATRSNGSSGLELLASLVHDVGLAVPILAGIGCLALRRQRWHDAIFLLIAFLVPLGTLVLLGCRVHVGTRYLFSGLVPGLVLAGGGLAHLLAPFLKRPLWSAVVLGLVSVPAVPVFLSQLRDNSRYPVPEVTPALEAAHRAGEPVFAESHAIAEYYSGIECTELPQTAAELAAALPPGRRAFVLLLLQRGRAVGASDPELKKMVERNLQLLTTAGKTRFDMHRFEAALFLWDPAWTPEP